MTVGLGILSIFLMNPYIAAAAIASLVSWIYFKGRLEIKHGSLNTQVMKLVSI